MDLRLAVLVLSLSGCETLLEQPRHADLQVDVSGADWGDEDRARLCITGVGTVESALGAGNIAFTGIPADIGELRLSVALLQTDRDNVSTGGVGDIVLSLDTPWQAVDWSACPEGCPACSASGDLAPVGSDSLLLAVRFL